jgi:hypothetical protein
MNDYGTMVRHLMMLATPVADKRNPLGEKMNPQATEGARGYSGGSRGYNPDGTVNARGKGAIDREGGKALADNPYFPGTKSHAAWEDGFKSK